MDDETDDGIDHEALDRYNAIRDGAWADAVKEVFEMNLPLEIGLPRNISGLCTRANDQYARTYDGLQERHTHKLPALFAYAQWVKWGSAWDGAHWFRRSIEDGTVGDNEYCREHCTPAGYARTEGWAYAVFNKMAELKFHALFREVLEHFAFDGPPSDHDVLQALELHWLWQASQGCASHAELLEVLHEAGEAGALANGLHMWDAGASTLLETLEADPTSSAAVSVRRVLAKAAAGVRHAPNQAVRERVVTRYKAERSQFTSKDAAAIAYTKDFPFEFSTIRDWLKGI
ncbi:hypothetical protein AAFF27_16580 [Xylophilus sp. GW821-FHT01B05]